MKWFNDFTKKAKETVENLLLKDEIDKTFRKLLKAAEVGINYFPHQEDYCESDDFPPKTATRIMERLFASPEQKKLKELMSELREKEPALVEKASSAKENKLNKHPKSITYKVFREIEKKFSTDILDLLGLIRTNPDRFPESYNFLANMLQDFEKEVDKKKGEKRKYYNRGQIKGCASKALAELEKLVKDIKEKKQSKNKPEEKTSTEPNPGSTEQNPTEKESNEGDNNSDDNSNKNKEKQTGAQPEPDSSKQKDHSSSTSSSNDNNPNQDLKKLKTSAIAEISRVLQETTITDQDLTETNRQWKNLIENSNDPDYINNTKEKLLAVIQQLKKEKENNNKLTELVAKGERTNDPAELKKIIAEIEGFRGEKVYTATKDKINALKKKLADQDIEGYCNTNKEIVEKELGDEGIKENELDTAIQAKLAKLKQGGIKQAEIDAIKDEVSDSIKLKKVEKELESLLKACRENTSPTKKKELLKKLLAFAENNNSFYQQIYQQRKDEIEKLRSQLAKSSNSIHQSPDAKNNFPLPAKIIIGGFLLTAVVTIIITITIKLNKQKKTKH